MSEEQSQNNLPESLALTLKNYSVTNVKIMHIQLNIASPENTVTTVENSVTKQQMSLKKFQTEFKKIGESQSNQTGAVAFNTASQPLKNR